MADNQFINFNSQDVADMYRRNQYARMLQEQANAPIERASYKGIEAPLHPVQGVAKMAAALLAGHQQNQMDERYNNEKAAAEQKMVDEQERRRAEVADYQKGFEPTVDYGGPTAAGVGDIAPQGQMVSKPRSRGEILAQALRGAGSENPQIANIGRMQYEQQNAMAQDENRAAERAQTREDMLSGREQAQQNYEGTKAQAQRIGDRAYGLQLEKLRQERLPSKKDLADEATKAQDQEQKSISTQEVLNGAVDLYNHPGRKAATGASSILGMVPGTAAKGFTAKLDTFKAQTFLPMVSALKGMGALSDAEGKKLSDAVGALDRGMPEEEFANSLKGITQYLYKKGKSSGLNLTQPDFGAKASDDAKLKSVLDMYAPKGK
jgi:hypothetical protein